MTFITFFLLDNLCTYFSKFILLNLRNNMLWVQLWFCRCKINQFNQITESWEIAQKALICRSLGTHSVLICTFIQHSFAHLFSTHATLVFSARFGAHSDPVRGPVQRPLGLFGALSELVWHILSDENVSCIVFGKNSNVDELKMF